MARGACFFILGGARAGKSAFALRLAREGEQWTSGEVGFIATAEAHDEDMQQRIVRHRAERPAHWSTLEAPRYINRALRQYAEKRIVIIDCLTLFVSNWLLATASTAVCERQVTAVIEDCLAIGREQSQTLIPVSNEVGLGVVPETSLGRDFRDMLGKVNQRLAQAADRVYWLVAGLPVCIKPSIVDESESGRIWRQ